METIKFSTGLDLESFNEGISDIGQFNINDKKILKKLVKEGKLIQFKRQWYPNLGRLRNTWINAGSPKIVIINDLLIINK